jgi:hypothetical protein
LRSGEKELFTSAAEEDKGAVRASGDVGDNADGEEGIDEGGRGILVKCEWPQNLAVGNLLGSCGARDRQDESQQ